MQSLRRIQRQPVEEERGPVLQQQGDAMSAPDPCAPMPYRQLLDGGERRRSVIGVTGDLADGRAGRPV